ncbi:hypothetical protein [Agrobacterium radiobacter]|uniref:hypothetical protein n=1 Tax=Agrobacterium radiobacter TaxID=362 RepID=UPI003F85ECC1
MAILQNLGVGLFPGIQRNSDALLQSGLGLLSGRTAPEQAAMGMKGFSDARKLNRTVEFLKTANPELAQAVEAGSLGAGDAYKLYYQQKLQAQKPKSYDFQTLPDGTYGTFDPESGSFNPMGKAAKPDTGVTSDISVREQAAQRFGLTPDSPGYQSYVLTGKMPREDAQPLTATDKKAILEADEMVLATQGAIPLIDRALELNDKAYSGPTAGIRGMIGGNLGLDAGKDTMELDNVVTSQALGQLKAIFGAAPTEGERRILLDIQGSTSQPPEVRKAIFERARQAAQRRLDFYQQRSSELRGGEFYKPSSGSNKGNRTSSGVSWSVEP